MYDENNLKLNIPNTLQYLEPGCKVKLGRFEIDRWIVKHGWYTWGGNRPFCGWYLESCDSLENKTVKPLQLTDLDDIYIIEN
jgi:hypothetical protein